MQIAMKEVTATEFKKWIPVNKCEESGHWYVHGGMYSGGLGINNRNWAYFGQNEFGPAYKAKPIEQVAVAIRVLNLKRTPYTYHVLVNRRQVPDQHGCNPGGW